MEQEIVYTDKYALILSDEEIKEGDWFFEKTGRLGPISFSRGKVNFHMKKIIAHLPLSDTPLFESDVPVLEGVPLLPPLPLVLQRLTHFEFEVEEIIPQDFSFGLHGNDEPPTELLPKTTTNSQGQLELVGKYFTKN
jgi:hypothetical protein